jgi:phenylacetate-CoA ligase
MLVVRGVNVYPSAVEAVLLADPAFTSHYALVVDRRGPLPGLEVHAELRAGRAAENGEAARLGARLNEHLRLRVQVVVRDPGELPRSEAGKVKRVFQRTADVDELVEIGARRPGA